MDSKARALDIVMQRLLETEQDYRLYNVHVSEFLTDAKGICGLRAACSHLAHDARNWMMDMKFCIAENLEESRLFDQ